MGHDHSHAGHSHGHAGHSQGAGDRNERRLLLAAALTTITLVAEAAGGIISGSLALLADAGHMLSDAAALALAIVAQKVAAQSRTRARTYGFRRAEVLAAFANGIALAVTAIWIFIEAASRWRDPPAIQGMAMTVTAVLGLIVNLAAAAMLGLGGHGHNVNTRAALAHVLTDALGSVGAILAGALVLLFGWNRADPLVSSLIGVLVLWGGWRLVRDTSRVLMEGSPVEIDVADLEGTLRGVPGVVDFHDLHVWSISDGFDVLTVHVVVAKGYHGIEVVASVSRALLEKHKLDHCTIQPEPERDEQLITIGRKAEPA